ncbi:MAG: tRNA (cytidine32/uridine32-2'-O)-methyltransferase [Bradymonadia bacterium]|jgi:tRNA (cytidine32/uridine32-2'-O)-methyltransferase
MKSASNVIAVLCYPKDPRNVGVAIRAVGNHGLRGLRIVCDVPFERRELEAFSSNYFHEVDVQEFSDLDEALADCVQVIGTSRRNRDPLAPPSWPAAGVGARLDPKGPVAILFGNERTGLVKSEVDRCQAMVWIPTAETVPSLNLSHAVAVMGYELARPSVSAEDDAALDGPAVVPPEQPRTPIKAREAFYRHAFDVTTAIGYPPGRTPELFTRRMRRILMRANPNPLEYGLFAGVLSEMKRLSSYVPRHLGGRAPEPTDEG